MGTSGWEEMGPVGLNKTKKNLWLQVPFYIWGMNYLPVCKELGTMLSMCPPRSSHLALLFLIQMKWKKTACKVESVSVRVFLAQWHLAFRSKEYHNITPCSKCHRRGLLGRRTEWQLPLNGKGDSRGLGGGAGFYIILGAWQWASNNIQWDRNIAWPSTWNIIVQG